MDETCIQRRSRVRMHCSLSLADGTEAFSTFQDDPLVFDVGDGTLFPALEENLLGMSAGQHQTFLLTAEHAYGVPDSSLIHALPHRDFAEAPAPGQILAFALPNGEETAGTVLAVEGDEVTIDFNHPLAGHNLVFRVEILAVGPAEGAV